MVPRYQRHPSHDIRQTVPNTIQRAYHTPRLSTLEKTAPDKPKVMVTVTFSLPNNNHLHIHKVYFVPRLTKNLLSVSQPTECGYTLTFKSNSCLFQSQLSNGTSYTFPCFKTQNLYPIPITPIKISNDSHQIHDTGIQNTLK